MIAGLGTPARGVVRHHGRVITYVTPEMRTRLGIRMLPGGKGVFNDLSIRENLEIATFNLRKDRPAMNAAIARVMELFPELAARPSTPAAALSGGQQQMLALAQVLVAETDILIIDELSLGLAPIMVERLVKVIEQLRQEGMTIIIVEQSLNVALAIADRAVFLEKGHVRFEGHIEELAGRDDLAPPCSSARTADDDRHLDHLAGRLQRPRPGAVYGLLAMSIVLVHRSSKVINFALGSMGLVGSGLLVLLMVKYGVPYWLALASPCWSAWCTERSSSCRWSGGCSPRHG